MVGPGVVSLADLTTLRLGGPPRDIAEPASADALIEVIAAADRAAEPVLVLGGGSNVVIADAGFGGTLVMTNRLEGVSLSRGDAGGVRVLAQAGVGWDALVEGLVLEGLTGLEFLSGIPGTVGATPIQNVGAYGSEVAQSILAVHAMDRLTGRSRTLLPAACGFAYRDSRFKRERGRWVVTAVEFELGRPGASEQGPPPSGVRYRELADALGIGIGESAPAADVRSAVLDLRRAKGMVLDPADCDTWSVGSFFTNPILDPAAAQSLPDDAPRFAHDGGAIKTSAAWLIERAGFAKGYRGPGGRVALSGKHTLALTNRGNGTTADLLDLAREIRAGVEARFGVILQPEPVLVGCEL